MSNNSTKVWVSILISSFAFLVMGYQLGERFGLLIGFSLAIILNFFVFYFGDNRILSQLNATKVQGQDAWGLTERVRHYSEVLNMPAPSVYITPHSAANAFCVGHSWKVGSLGFTTGLLTKLNEEELDCVVAHQMCHIRNLDTFSFGVSSVLANSIVGLGQFLDSLLPFKMKFFMSLLSPIGWLLIKTVVLDKTFFTNDLMTAELMKNRTLLGEILWRLEGLAQTKPLEIPPCTSHLFMVNPEGFKQKNLFLKSHPTIELRLKKLMGYYPI